MSDLSKLNSAFAFAESFPARTIRQKSGRSEMAFAALGILASVAFYASSNPKLFSGIQETLSLIGASTQPVHATPTPTAPAVPLLRGKAFNPKPAP